MTNAELIQKIRAEIERNRQAIRVLNEHTAPEQMSKTCAIFQYSDSILSELLSFLSTLEQSEKPVNPEDAMKELDEKIALVKRRGTWNGVDVEKYMDEVRGREPEKPINQDLEKELARFYLKDLCGSGKDEIPEATLHHNFPIMWDDLRDIARHFAEWGADHTPIPEDTVLFNKGVEEGKRLMMEEAVEGKVFMSFAPGHNQMVMADVDLPTNTKVRVIVLPMED